jgi:hypothetical protein
MSAKILASLIKGFPKTTTTKQNVDLAVHFVCSRIMYVTSPCTVEYRTVSPSEALPVYDDLLDPCKARPW